MKIVETTIREGLVRILFANASYKDNASEWIELQFEAKSDDSRQLAEVQSIALRHAQAVIDAEMNRLRLLVGQTRG